MAQEYLQTPKRIIIRAFLPAVLIILGVVSWGSWHSSRSSQPAHPLVQVSQSASDSSGETIVPVGGEIIDGVFHPEESFQGQPLYETASLRSGRTAGRTISSSLRMSSKLYSARKSERLATT